MTTASRLFAASAVLSLTLAGAAFAQADPFGTLYGGAKAGGTGGTGLSNPSRTGSQGVSTAVGASYAGSRQTGQGMSLAQIAFLPKTTTPFPIELKGSGTKFLARRPRIAVPTYALGFVHQSEASASAAGQGSDITPRSTKVSASLIGMPPDLEQRLADEAYADLVARLKAAGFDVVPSSEAQAAPHLQSLTRPSAQPGKPMGSPKSWVAYGAREAPLIRGYALDMGLSTPGASIAMGKISQELDAVVLLPAVMIDHLAIGGSGRALYRGSASVDAELKFSVTANSIIPFVWGNERGGTMPGTFNVKPFASSEAFGIMYPLENRSDSVGLHNAMAGAGFGSVYRQSLVYGVEVVPERFAALTRAAFQGVNQSLVNEILRARSQ